MVVSSEKGMQAIEAKPLLQIRGVTFGYERQPLLYNVSLSIEAGEMVGLLGPNGSGKTTLLRLLSGVLQPQEGEVLLEGRDVRRWERRRLARRIAVVPQELHMPFAFTVEHMVSLGRTPFVRPFLGSLNRNDHLVVRDAMSATGVAALAERIFNELSGGERQRVMIAMALAQEPAALLLDEPTSHLDIKYQVETLELVQKLNRERGVTVVAAMHDLNLAARYFPRLILFQRAVVADAGPAQVLEPGLLGRVYGVNVQVGIMRGATHLSVLPPGDEQSEELRQTQPAVHVMAGGGSGEVLMRALADAHIPFVAGALNIGDSDHTLALRLADDVITEQPYAPISAEALARVRESLARVELLIICPAPIGPGNLVLLQEAVAAGQRGLPVVLLSPGQPGDAIETDDGAVQQSAMAARDYTGGSGVQLMGKLLQEGAVVAGSVGAVLDIVSQKALKDATDGERRDQPSHGSGRSCHL
jgi:iron complex transport system ATP-binding protein